MSTIFAEGPIQTVTPDKKVLVAAHYEWAVIPQVLISNLPTQLNQCEMKGWEIFDTDLSGFNSNGASDLIGEEKTPQVQEPIYTIIVRRPHYIHMGDMVKGKIVPLDKPEEPKNTTDGKK